MMTLEKSKAVVLSAEEKSKVYTVRKNYKALKTRKVFKNLLRQEI